MDILNFRSDTQTLPTEEMLDAMRVAPLGDDVFGEDPTVKKLEAMAAAKMGREAATLVISGTMGNLVALMTHASGLGGEAIVDPEAHIFYYEGGGLCSIAGWTPMPVMSHAGMLDPDEVAAAVRKPNIHFPSSRLLCMENTHNRSGGRVVPLDLHKRLCNVAHERGLAVHLDGARIFNAAIAAGVPASAYAEDCDSVQFCLSKGLSCPLGSVLVGSAAFIEKAKFHRKRVGGGMRQAGIIAAAGIVALETMIDRLADDHANAKTLANGIDEIDGLSVDMTNVETNMVNVDHTGTGLTTAEVVARIKAAGVLVGERAPSAFRMVVNRHAGRPEIEEAISRVRQAVRTAD